MGCNLDFSSTQIKNVDFEGMFVQGNPKCFENENGKIQWNRTLDSFLNTTFAFSQIATVRQTEDNGLLIGGSND